VVNWLLGIIFYTLYHSISLISTFQKALALLFLHHEKKPEIEQETVLVLVVSYSGVSSAKKRTTITVMLSDDPRCTASSASRAA
jgi:hypothetical protein